MLFEIQTLNMCFLQTPNVIWKASIIKFSFEMVESFHQMQLKTEDGRNTIISFFGVVCHDSNSCVLPRVSTVHNWVVNCFELTMHSLEMTLHKINKLCFNHKSWFLQILCTDIPTHRIICFICKSSSVEMKENATPNWFETVVSTSCQWT